MEVREPGLYGSAASVGRSMLRTLRESAGLSQQELANRLIESGYRLDQAHIQKIESGAIRNPTAPTIDAILTVGLSAPYRIRIDVLAAFGHRLLWELPTAREIEVERHMCHDELTRSVWPSYLVDYSHRIWDWNPLFPRLLGNTPDDPMNEHFRGVTVLDILFNPEINTYRQISNVGSFGPVVTAWIKIMMKPYTHEKWHQDLISRASTWPGFREMWDAIPSGPDVLLEHYPVIPVAIQVPRIQAPLVFRTVHAPVAPDPRFAIVHLIPLDAHTQTTCTGWAGDAGAALASSAFSSFPTN